MKITLTDESNAKKYYDDNEKYVEILREIGYVDSKRKTDTSVDMALMFFKNPKQHFHIDDLIELNVSKPTVYRHLNKLYELGLVERTHSNHYKLRNGSIKHGFEFTKLKVAQLMDNIAKKIEQLES